MNAQKLLFPKGNNDECYTPRYFVELILPYIPEGAVVWCPFDTEESWFVKLIKLKGNKVIHSHIIEGKDFFHYEPAEHWDILISNPPFTNKRLILDRILSFGKPFGIVITESWWNDASPIDAFLLAGKTHWQEIKTNKRVDYQNTGKIMFMSGYLCSDLLPRDTVIAPLKKATKSRIKRKMVRYEVIV